MKLEDTAPRQNRWSRLLGREGNPVLVRDLRTQWRGRGGLVAFIVLAIVVPTIFLARALHSGDLGILLAPYADPGSTAIGREIAWAAGFMEVVVLALIAPALTMRAFSGEVERRTWDLLLMTPLSGVRIAAGKVGGALLFVVPLVLAVGMPLMAVAYLAGGGVSILELIRTQVGVAAAALVFLSIGAFCSAMLRHTVRATVASYALTMLLCAAPLVADGVRWGVYDAFDVGDRWPHTDLAQFLPMVYGPAQAARPLSAVVGPVALADDAWGSSGYRRSLAEVLLSPMPGSVWLESTPWAPGSTPAWLFLYACSSLLSLAHQVLASAVLVTLAGARIRRLGPRGYVLLIVLGLAVLLWVLTAAAVPGNLIDEWRRYEC